MTAIKKRARPSQPRRITYAADNRPTGERLAHGVEIMVGPLSHDDRRAVLRIHSGLAHLLEAGKVGVAEVVAANRWRRDYELGAHGAHDPECTGTGSGGVDAHLISAIDALTRYRWAARAVGSAGDALLRAFVSDGLSFRAIGARLGKDNRDLSAQTAFTLGMLVEHYAEVDADRDPPAWERSQIRAAARGDGIPSGRAA